MCAISVDAARDTEQPRTADFAGVRARLCVPANQHAGLCIRTNLSTACTANKFEYAEHSRVTRNNVSLAALNAAMSVIVVRNLSWDTRSFRTDTIVAHTLVFNLTIGIIFFFLYNTGLKNSYCNFSKFIKNTNLIWIITMRNKKSYIN